MSLFSIVTVKKPTKQGILATLVGKISPQKPIAVQKEAANVRYCEITTPQKKKGPDWQRIFQLGEHDAHKIVLSHLLSLPPEESSRQFSPVLYQRRLAVNTAVQALVRSGVPMYARSIGIVDEEGVCQEEVRHLVTLSPVVKIFTREPEEYDAFSEEMMECFGAPLVLCDRMEAMADCLVVVSTRSAELEVTGRFPPPIFSSGATKVQGGAKVVDRLVPMLPEELRHQIPWDINHADFAGALWELGGVEWLGDLYGQWGMCKENRVEFSRLSSYLQEQYKKLRRI